MIDDAPRASKALLTLIVDDLDQQLAALAERGIAPDSFETKPHAYRKAIVIDPEGNTISFAELTTEDG